MAAKKSANGHKAKCTCPICKNMRKGAKKKAKKSATKKSATKKTAKKPSVKKATPRTTAFQVGFAEGERDVHCGRPLRKVAARKDPFSDGYRHGTRAARAHRKHHR